MMEAAEATRVVAVATGLALFGAASLQDWALRLVPNRIPTAIAVTGFLLQVAGGTLLRGLGAAALVFTLTALCWLRGWLGGADVKLFAAGTLLVAPGLVPAFVLASCVAGGVLAVLYAGLARLVPKPSRVRPRTRLRRFLRLEQRRLHNRGPLPYATAIAAGAAFTLLGGG